MKDILKEKHSFIKTNYSDLLAQGVTFNQILVEIYKIETGAEDFKTFKKWKEEGYKINKGEKGFPVFSKPSTKLKEERGQEIGEGEKARFFTAYLFNENQVSTNQ
jgi:hypothetical protein